METLKELAEKYTLPGYQESYNLLVRISFRLYQWKEEELFLMVAKKTAGIKMLIDHIKSM